MDADYFQAVLSKNDDDKRVVEVIKYEEESPVPKGQNYASQITRVKLEVILGSGRKSKKSLIVKQEHGEGKTKDSIIETSIFKTEIQVYCNLLKKMEHLMDDNDDIRGKFWPELIGYEKYSKLIFEDLSAQGFAVAEKKNALDLNHGLLVMATIGRFHAMSRVLFQRSLISKEDFTPWYVSLDREFIANMFRGGLKQLSLTMMAHWPPKWKTVAEKIGKEADVVVSKMQAIFKNNVDLFPVVTHADIWTSNMMFKYSEMKPTAVRFLDFQAACVGGYMYDAVHFLYGSIDPVVRRKNLSLFYKTYWESLTQTLELHGYKGDVPTYEDVLKDAERFNYIGFVVLTVFFPLLIADDGVSLDTEAMADAENCHNAYNVGALKAAKFIEKVSEDLINFSNKGSV